MLGTLRKNAEKISALNRVEAWTRSRFSLSSEEVVLVSELACALPGCPPLETIVAFWTRDQIRHHFKIFKRVEEVVNDDIPYAWLKRALAVPDGFDPYCC